MLPKLQYISQGATAEQQLYNIEQALNAGVKWIQLRFKNAEHRELLDIASKVKDLCESYSSKLIVNDHPSIAKYIDADGVHLGLLDQSIWHAREVVGEGKIIGGTANTFEDVVQRVNEGCNYIGLGPFRYTTTKEKLSPILGANGFRLIIEMMKQKQYNIPVYAIGGITAEDVTAIMDTGVFGVAVSGLITNHPQKKYLIEQLNLSLNEELNYSRKAI